MKEDELGDVCSTHWICEKCMLSFSWKAWRQDTAWQI